MPGANLTRHSSDLETQAFQPLRPISTCPCPPFSLPRMPVSDSSLLNRWAVKRVITKCCPCVSHFPNCIPGDRGRTTLLGLLRVLDEAWTSNSHLYWLLPAIYCQWLTHMLLKNSVLSSNTQHSKLPLALSYLTLRAACGSPKQIPKFGESKTICSKPEKIEAF